MSFYIRQFFEPESSTYTYMLVDKVSQQVMVVDPVLETFLRDSQWIEEMGLTVKYLAETHIHADHITSAARFKEKCGGEIIIGRDSGLQTADLLLEDGQEFLLGETKIKALLTPGHTSGCTCYLVGESLFTGDTLMIRGCGRTDFQEGRSETLFDSVREKLFTLPDQTRVYPGHDYRGRTQTTIGEEKRFNPRLNLNKSKQEFVNIMNELKLAKPKKIDIAVPANLKSGA